MVLQENLGKWKNCPKRIIFDTKIKNKKRGHDIFPKNFVGSRNFFENPVGLRKFLTFLKNPPRPGVSIVYDRSLTLLIITKTSKNRRFFPFFPNRVRFPDNTVRTADRKNSKYSLKPAQDMYASNHI